MLLEVEGEGESAAALGALELLVLHVRHHVRGQRAGRGVRLAAHRACERLLPRVRAQVDLERVRLAEPAVAVLTHVLLLSHVDSG